MKKDEDSSTFSIHQNTPALWKGKGGNREEKKYKALELLLLAIKDFFPKIMKIPFHMCMHINSYEWKQEGKELA